MRQSLFLMVGIVLVSTSVWSQSISWQLVPYLQAKGTTHYVLKEPTFVQIKVPTSAGVIEGEIKVAMLDLRGPEGWSKFMFRLTLDPKSFTSGDALRDKYVIENMLKPHLGEFYLYSLERIEPPWGPDGEAAGLPKIKGWFDPIRQGAYVEIPYQWSAQKGGGTLRISHEATLKDFGIQAPKHPFVKITGPLAVRLTAKMARVSKSKETP